MTCALCCNNNGDGNKKTIHSFFFFVTSLQMQYLGLILRGWVRDYYRVIQPLLPLAISPTCLREDPWNEPCLIVLATKPDDFFHLDNQHPTTISDNCHDIFWPVNVSLFYGLKKWPVWVRIYTLQLYYVHVQKLSSSKTCTKWSVKCHYSNWISGW